MVIVIMTFEFWPSQVGNGGLSLPGTQVSRGPSGFLSVSSVPLLGGLSLHDWLSAFSAVSQLLLDHLLSSF